MNEKIGKIISEISSIKKIYQQLWYQDDGEIDELNE
jgi:hypothetical protein